MKKIIALLMILVMAAACASSVMADEIWICKECGTENSKNFCKECGAEKEEKWECASCGELNDGKFCENCGAERTIEYDIKASEINVGDIIEFGAYEQDNDTSNGKEAIEWIVLDIQDGKALLLSKYGLDVKVYNEEWVDITWEECTLRTWLNGEFITEAFSEGEQDCVAITEVTADANPEYGTEPGNDTQDKVFLLSITEAEMYFDSDDDRQCEPTAYAVANGAYKNKGNCWWWLRSPGRNSLYAAGVYGVGSVLFHGHSVDSGNDAIRPALWINLES